MITTMSGAAYRWLMELIMGEEIYRISLRRISFSPEQERDIARHFLQVAQEQFGPGDEEERGAFDKMCGLSDFSTDQELISKLPVELGQSQEWNSDLVHWMADKMTRRCDGLVLYIKQIAEANRSSRPKPSRTPEQVDSITVDGEIRTA